MSKTGGWIGSKMALCLVLASALSMLAYLALSAYAPQLRSDSNGQANALSKSAIGFAGLRFLLEESGTDVVISRGRAPMRNGLLILTPQETSNSSEIAELSLNAPTLIILPKWPAVGDPFHRGWVVKTQTYAPSVIAELLKGFAATSVIQHRSGEARVAFAARVAPFDVSPWARKMSIDTFQTIQGKGWVPDITDDLGDSVLVHLAGSQIYVLSEPDLVDTQALREPAAAEAALELVRRLRGRSAEVTFDVTLNGLGASPSLLRTAFAPPFLGATLCALLAAALLAFHAFSRFGTPRPEERTFAFGKRSLADNTAALIKMMNRQPRMARRYAMAVRRLAGRILKRGRAEEFNWLETVERTSNIHPGFAALIAEADLVDTDTALMKVAAKLHEWRMRITHECS